MSPSVRVKLKAHDFDARNRTRLGEVSLKHPLNYDGVIL